MSATTPISPYQWWYGRDEPPLESRLLRAGPVTARLVGRDLRNVRFGGTEIAQRIYVAVRDRNWDTIPGEVSDLTVEQEERPLRGPLHRHPPPARHRLGLAGRDPRRARRHDQLRDGRHRRRRHDLQADRAQRPPRHARICRPTLPAASPQTDRSPTPFRPRLPRSSSPTQTEVPIFPPVESLTAATRRRRLRPLRFRGRHLRVRGSAQLDRRLLQVAVVPAAPRRLLHHPRRGAGLAEGDDHAHPARLRPPPTMTVRSGSRSGTAPRRRRAATRSDSAWRATAGNCRSAKPTSCPRSASTICAPTCGLPIPAIRPSSRGPSPPPSTLGCGLELALHLTDDAENAARRPRLPGWTERGSTGSWSFTRVGAGDRSALGRSRPRAIAGT